MLNTFFQRLSDDLELEAVPQEEEGIYRLELTPEMTLQIRKQDPGVSFFGILGTCPTLKQEELFIYLMKANFLGQGTGGASIGLSQDENLLTLSLVLPYDMAYKTFKDALEDFVNYLRYWTEELIRHQQRCEQSVL